MLREPSLLQALKPKVPHLVYRDDRPVMLRSLLVRVHPVVALSLVASTVVPALAHAQLVAARQAPVAYGHHHVSATDIAAHKRFWVDTLGGTSVRVGTSTAEIIRFPNVLVFLSDRDATGGTKGTTVNHVGFRVPDIVAALDRVRAAGYPIVTETEAPTNVTVKDGVGYTGTATRIAYVMGPDDTKVEFVEESATTGAIALHHIHFAAPDALAMRDWYVKTFNATAMPRGATFEIAELPGVRLSFTPTKDPVVGTQGRAMDHIGFEVDNLEAFCRQLEAAGVTFDRPFTQVPALGISIAFFTDPWGTYIELTEGLDKVN